MHRTVIVNHPDPRTQRAVDILIQDPTRTVPQAMRAAGFSVGESLNRTKQMWIRRRLPAKKSMPGESKSNYSHTSNDVTTTVKSKNTTLNLKSLLSAASVAPSLPQQQQQPPTADECVGEDQLKCKCNLLEWISISRDIFVAGQLGAKPRMRTNYLQVCLQILHSLADKIIVVGCSDSQDSSRISMGEGDTNIMKLAHPSFICIENIILYKSTTQPESSDGGDSFSASFIRCVYFPCFQKDSEDQAPRMMEAAMYAFARIAYTMFMMGVGPKFPEYSSSSCETTKSSGMKITDALNLRDGGDDAFRKVYFMNDEESCGQFISAMCDAGIPLPLRKFIYDLMGEEYGIFCTHHTFSSFRDVRSDLEKLLKNADVF